MRVCTYLCEYALGGIRTHETGLYQARGYPDTPPGRPAYAGSAPVTQVLGLYIVCVCSSH